MNVVRIEGVSSEGEVSIVYNREQQRTASDGRTGNEWPKPEAIQSQLPLVDVFSEQLLPEPFRPLVLDVAERMQVPMDYPAAAIVLCLSGAVNRRATIQPKANDTSWCVVPNLWGGIVAPPGYLKSPVIQYAIRPLSRIQSDWLQEHEAAKREFARRREEYDLSYAAWKERYKQSTKSNKTAPPRPDDEPPI